jgi:hypothetical protein
MEDWGDFVGAWVNYGRVIRRLDKFWRTGVIMETRVNYGKTGVIFGCLG